MNDADKSKFYDLIMSVMDSDWNKANLLNELKGNFLKNIPVSNCKSCFDYLCVCKVDYFHYFHHTISFVSGTFFVTMGQKSTNVNQLLTGTLLSQVNKEEWTLLVKNAMNIFSECWKR